MKILKILIITLMAASAVSAQSYQIDWSVIASGGGHAESGNYQADGTIGQAVAGQASSESYTIQAGYWAGFAEGSVCGIYVIGDYNGSLAFNVADIIAAFSKLKTGTPDADLFCDCAGDGNFWAVAMDVNNSCAFNVADVIAGFSKLKTGTPELVPCELCPPEGGSPRRGGDQPLVVPVLQTKAKIVNTQ
ncbi:MAG: hypothetical protein V3W18_02345 [candidate division Zixibacteria bacterium]